MPSGTEEYLLSVWGASENDVFAVGDNSVILHFDGKQWAPMQSGTENYLVKVKGIAASGSHDPAVLSKTAWTCLKLEKADLPPVIAEVNQEIKLADAMLAVGMS